MTNKGKHASQTPGTFYRDLAIMILGIVVVGAAVFFLLYVIADEPDTGPIAADGCAPGSLGPRRQEQVLEKERGELGAAGEVRLPVHRDGVLANRAVAPFE